MPAPPRPPSGAASLEEAAAVVAAIEAFLAEAPEPRPRPSVLASSATSAWTRTARAEAVRRAP